MIIDPNSLKNALIGLKVAEMESRVFDVLYRSLVLQYSIGMVLNKTHHVVIILLIILYKTISSFCVVLIKD